MVEEEDEEEELGLPAPRAPSSASKNSSSLSSSPSSFGTKFLPGAPSTTRRGGSRALPASSSSTCAALSCFATPASPALSPLFSGAVFWSRTRGGEELERGREEAFCRCSSLSPRLRKSDEVFGRSGRCCSCSPPEAVTASTAAEAVRDSRRLDVVGQGMAAELAKRGARTQECESRGRERERGIKRVSFGRERPFVLLPSSE